MAEIDLEFIARQLERVLSEMTGFRNEMAGFRDDMTVVMARLDRIDVTTQSMVTEVRAMHSRHDRLARRMDRIEGLAEDEPDPFSPRR